MNYNTNLILFIEITKHIAFIYNVLTFFKCRNILYINVLK